MNLLALLPTGREHATSVARLSYATGESDRTIRAEIERLVLAGFPVVTLPTNPGVFLAETPEEIDLADKHLKSKAMAMLRRRRALRFAKTDLQHNAGRLF
jgi:hypothetical protein